MSYNSDLLALYLEARITSLYFLPSPITPSALRREIFCKEFEASFTQQEREELVDVMLPIQVALEKLLSIPQVNTVDDFEPRKAAVEEAMRNDEFGPALRRLIGVAVDQLMGSQA